MNFNTFKMEFKEFCESPDVESGKAESYAKSMIYMAQFLHHTQMDLGAASDILSHSEDLCNRHSAFFLAVSRQFTADRHSSYLTGGFVRAALPYLNAFRDHL